MNDLIIDNLKEIKLLQNNIKFDESKIKNEKHFSFSKYLRDIHEGKLSFKDADKEHIQLVNKLKDANKVKILLEKNSFLKNVGLFNSARVKILSIFESKVLPIQNLDKTSTPEPEPETAL